MSSHFPNLSRPQAKLLALWSFSVMIAHSALLTACARLLAQLAQQRVNSVRQRLKEFYQPAHVKRGLQRRQLDLACCFPHLFRWVLELWPARELTLALDPTLCRDRFVSLAISLVYEGGSIPLAWRILPANRKGAWLPHWRPLLEQLSIPETVDVFVLADRGLASPELFEEIRTLGFHPILRLPMKGYFRPEGSHRWFALGSILPAAGTVYLGTGALFKKDALPGTLIALWEEPYDEPWLLITDLPPERCRGAFYGLRSWIEHGFRTIKSFGLQWERNRMGDPERIERLWLVYALALLWAQAMGGQIESTPEVLDRLGLRPYDLSDSRGRKISRYRLGELAIVAVALGCLKDLPLPQALHPGPMPIIAGCRHVQLLKEQQE